MRPILVCAALLWTSLAAAEPVGLPNTERLELTSKTNGVDYALYVSFPPGYPEKGKRYPVVYLLDAHYSFAIARNITEHLTERNDLPPLILVGIAYGGPDRYRVNRTRDYTPRHSPTGGYGAEYQKHSGGGPKFLAFIETELIPFIDARYPTAGERGLVGHSYGALFSTWVLLTRPGLFDVQIIVSPSLWYHDEWIFGVERELEKGTLPGRAYFAVGAMENRVMSRTLVRMAEALRARHPSVKVRHEIFEGETHNSVFPTALSRGLRWGFGGR